MKQAWQRPTGVRVLSKADDWISFVILLSLYGAEKETTPFGYPHIDMFSSQKTWTNYHVLWAMRAAVTTFRASIFLFFHLLVSWGKVPLPKRNLNL
jgi:hypothetical protein